MRKYDSIISVGGACEVAFQVRAFTGNNSASLFDWWITPFDGVIRIVENDFSGLLEDDNMTLVAGRSVQCSRYGIVHHHDFRRDEQGFIARDEIATKLPQLREKYLALKSRLISACAKGKDVLLVRGWLDRLHETRSHADATSPPYDFVRFSAAFRERFPDARISTLFVNYGHQSADIEGAVFDNVTNYDDRRDWRGSTRGWQEMLERHAMLEHAEPSQ